MRTLSILAPILALAGAVDAQAPQGYELLPGRGTGQQHHGISATHRRPHNGAWPAMQALQMYDVRFANGIGDRRPDLGTNRTSLCEIRTVRVLYGDLNSATSEAFKVVARAESAPGSRLANVKATLFTQSVPGAPAGPGGTGNYRTTVQIMTGGKNDAIPIPCDKTFFFGIELPANSTFPQDGLTVAISLADRVPGMPTGTPHDWPKGGLKNAYLYDDLVLTTSGWLSSRPGWRGVFAFSLIPDAPILQAGALHEAGTSPHGADAGFGAAGIWPEVDGTTARGKLSQDGLVIRITDNGAKGLFGLYASLNSAVKQKLPIIQIPGIRGGIYLGIPNFFVTSGTLTGVDTLQVLAKPRTLPSSLIGTTVYLQAYTAPGTAAAPHLTNAAGVQFK